MRIFLLFIFAFLFFANLYCKAQTPVNHSEKDSLKSSTINKSRLHKLAGGFAIGFGGSLYLLNKAWYSKETGTSFHFYNDMDHWNQIDKSGHFWSAFQQSRLGVDMLLWSGMDRIQSIWIGGMLGVVLQAPIEVFDGFSDDYGASWSDFGFNMAGSTFLIAQQLAWNEIRIMPKYSFHTTAYAPLRPQTFGKSLPEQMLKDYNGQSYWLSFNLSAFLPHDSNYPKWLNIATGYAASQMVYGSPRDNNNYGYTAYRRFFISPDINLQNIKTSSKFLKKTFYILSAFRIPMPAIELNSKMQVKFHPLYY